MCVFLTFVIKLHEMYFYFVYYVNLQKNVFLSDVYEI